MQGLDQQRCAEHTPLERRAQQHQPRVLERLADRH